MGGAIWTYWTGKNGGDDLLFSLAYHIHTHGIMITMLRICTIKYSRFDSVNSYYGDVINFRYAYAMGDYH